MRIELLDEVRFDNFASTHKYANYFQTSNYGKLMTKNGHNSYYLGLLDETNNIKAATLIIVKNDKNERKKTGYAPRGFLIDWEDDSLVTTFTNLLIEFLSKRGFTSIKLDPKVIYKEHNTDGTDKEGTIPKDEFVKKLQTLGYIHMGYNNKMEASKPRWNAIMNLNPDITALYNTLSKEARQKIKTANQYGCKVYKGSKEDINLFYDSLEKKDTPLDYYLDYYQFFNLNNKFEMYFSKLEPVTYVNATKMLFSKEEETNQSLNLAIQDINLKDKEQLINEKLKSDEDLARYKKNMLEAINLFQSYPSGIIIAATAVIKHNNTITFLDTGVNDSFMDKYPDYILKWHLMQEFAIQGYKVMECNGIIGEFDDSYYNLSKRELSNLVVEYIGEFDLVINKKAYYSNSKLDPILNWLNTPI